MAPARQLDVFAERAVPVGTGMSRPTLPAAQWSVLLLDGFIVGLVLVVVVVDDPQDLDEAEGGSQPA